MLDIRIFKPLDCTTASAELYEGETLVAEVFAKEGGRRRLYTHDPGVDWMSILQIAPHVSAALDVADGERRQVERWVRELGS